MSVRAQVLWFINFFDQLDTLTATQTAMQAFMLRAGGMCMIAALSCRHCHSAGQRNSDDLRERGHACNCTRAVVHCFADQLDTVTAV